MEPAQSQQRDEIPGVQSRVSGKVDLAEVSPVAVFEVGVTAEAENPSIAVPVCELKDLFQQPGVAKLRILHVIEGKQAEAIRFEPLGTKTLDGEFCDCLFSAGRSIRSAAFDGRRR